MKFYTNQQGPAARAVGAEASSEAEAAAEGRGGGGSAAGVKVLEVTPGSPADRAGMREGDTITGFDGRPVVRNRDILERLGYEYGRSIDVEVLRDGRRESLTIISSKPPAGRARGNA